MKRENKIKSTVNDLDSGVEKVRARQKNNRRIYTRVQKSNKGK